MVLSRWLFALTASASLALAAPGQLASGQIPLDNVKLSQRPVAHTVVEYPAPSSEALVKPVLETLSADNLRQTLTTYTSFPNRHHMTPWGLIAQRWLFNKVIETTVTASSHADAKWLPDVTEVFHPNWTQNSIVARINGSDRDAGLIIIGAHLDSKNYKDPEGIAPGADDDGSGTVTILETYRALLAANFTPTRTVEFHWYAAEEGGLLGSREVARLYHERGANVTAMLQMDATAWVQKGTREEIGISTTNTTGALVDYLGDLVNAYCDLPWNKFTPPKGPGSDHMAWDSLGYPATWVAEGSFEHMGRYFHTPDDRIDISDEFSFDHAIQFSKLGVAFAIELGGWKKSD